MKRIPPDVTPDPAAGGYYVVQDRGDGQFNVCGYSAKGVLLLNTWHVCENSMRIECEAWKARGATEHRFGFPSESKT